MLGKGPFRPGLYSAHGDDGNPHLFRSGCLVGVLEIRFPHFFQIVELPDFGPKQMDDDIAGIDQHLVTLPDTFGPDADHPFLLEGLNKGLGERDDLARGAPARDHHIVRNAGFALEADGDHLFGLVVV